MTTSSNVFYTSIDIRLNEWYDRLPIRAEISIITNEKIDYKNTESEQNCLYLLFLSHLIPAFG